MPGLAHVINERLRGFGLEVGHYPPLTHALSRRRRLLRHAATDLVLDVGANTGQFVDELRRHQQYRGRVVSFEPLSSAFAVLAQAARGDSLWDVQPIGLADFCGATQLQVAGNSRSSSILAMLPRHLAAAPESHCIGTQPIEVRTLDSLFAQVAQDARHVWLKIDTQGYEHHVLAGARASLERIEVVQIEMSLVPLYAGSPTLQQSLSLMGELGYRLIGLEPGFEDAGSGALLQVDGIFRREAGA
jgi:FkbM family methyltransferase